MYDLEEQEKIDAVKDWWKRHGNAVMLAVGVFAASFAGVQGWRHYQQTQIEKAATLYESVEQAAGGVDAKKTSAAAQALIDQYPRSAYASRAALLSARASYEAGAGDAAKARLQWVIDNSQEPSLQGLARLRLARILAGEKKYPEALALLSALGDPSFSALAADLKGDILAAQGKSAEARTAYRMVVDSPSAAQIKQLAQIKLDALGDAK